MNSEVMKWQGFIGFEGIETVDGRLIEPNALYWDLPLPLWESDPNVEYAYTPVGVIRTIERQEGGGLWATGTLEREPVGAHLAMTLDPAQPDSRESDGEVLVITGGRVRGVTVGVSSAWGDDCRIEVVR